MSEDKNHNQELKSALSWNKDRNRFFTRCWISICLNFILFFGLEARDARTSSFQLLNSNYSPIAVAVGGTHPSFTNIHAVFTNPAGLAEITGAQLMFSYSHYLFDFNGGFLGGIIPVRQWGNILTGMSYLNYGKFIETDRFGNITTEQFIPQELNLMTGYATNLWKWVYFGITGKYAYAEIDRFSASAVSIDLGMLMKIHSLDDLTLGAAVKNLGGSLNAFNSMKESLPLIYNIGLAKTFRNNSITIYLGLLGFSEGSVQRTSWYRNWAIGVDALILPALNIRLGYNNNVRENLQPVFPSGINGFSAGLSLNLGKEHLDYGMTHMGDLGVTQLIGFSYSLNGKEADTQTSSSLKNYDQELDFYEVPPPQQLEFRILEEQLVISWKGFEEATYNIYARHQRESYWTKLNREPVKDNFMIYKKPQMAGIYYFKITSLYRDRESYFSKEISVNIE